MDVSARVQQVVVAVLLVQLAHGTNADWTQSAGQWCSANWAVDNAPPYVTGESLDACKTECLAASGCYGIAFTPGDGQCVTCTGADMTLVGDGAWDYYGLEAATGQQPCLPALV